MSFSEDLVIKKKKKKFAKKATALPEIFKDAKKRNWEQLRKLKWEQSYYCFSSKVHIQRKRKKSEKSSLLFSQAIISWFKIAVVTKSSGKTPVYDKENRISKVLWKKTYLGS